jgi:transaldolase
MNPAPQKIRIIKDGNERSFDIMATATVEKTRREALLEELARGTEGPAGRERSAPGGAPSFESDPLLARLNALGTEVWLDTGDLDEAKKLWRREMGALTTNNTLVNQVVQTGRMDDVIREAARRIRETEPTIAAGDLVLDIVFVVNCRIAQRLVEAFDVPVSVELHPAVAFDIDRTVGYARRYFAVNPDHFLIKIPLTPEGYCAVARVRSEGIPVNYTLGFSARQNYLAALLSNPSYVNVFLGRLNAVVADNHLGDGKFVGEKTALASQAAVRELRDTHPHISTRQIAASMRAGDQVASLVGMDVFTVPPKALEEFLAHGYKPGDIVSRLEERYEVKLADSTDKSSIEVLWTIDDAFKAFAGELADRGGTTLTGDDLRQADKRSGTKLFADFSPDERAAIREKGKIPDVARFAGRAALDDLMTESALRSFEKDQAAFDDYVKRIAASV